MAQSGVGAGNRVSADVTLPRRRAHVEERSAGSELVLYDPVGGRLHVLNATAAAVWRLCDGSLPAVALAGRFSDGFLVGRDQDPLADVKELLCSFLEAGLIEDRAGDHPAASGAAPARPEAKTEDDPR